MPSKLVLPGTVGAYVSTPASKPITVAAGSVSRTSNVVTWNAPANHGVRVGDSLTVALADSSYNGTRTPDSVVGNTITWPHVAADDTDGGTGTITNTTSFRLPGFTELWADIAADTYLGPWITFASVWSGSAGQFSILWGIVPDGRMRVIWTPTGLNANEVEALSANPNGVPDGRPVTFRIRLWPVYGTGWRAEFGVFDKIDGILLQDLGAASGSPSSSIFSGTSQLEIGSRNSGAADVFAGNYYRLLLRDSTGVMLAAPDFTLQSPGATTFADITGRTYTVNGTAVIVDEPAPPVEPPPAPTLPRPDVVELELDDEVLVFDEPNGLVNTALDLGWPTIRPVVADRPLADGTVDTTERFGARAVSLNIAALDTTERTWKQNLRRLGRFVAAKKRPTLHLRLDDVDYRIGLAPDQASAPFEHPFHALAQVAFRAPDPYLRSDSKSVSALPFKAGTAGRTYPLLHPRVYPESDSRTGEVQAVNDGTVDVWPLVSVWGPLVTSFTLENITTGELFSMASTTVDAGHRLEVDMLNRTVYYDGNPELPRFSLINFVSSSWIHLQPGVNLLRFATGATSDAVVDVTWSDAYLWPGGI
jgi:hypothetical protein